MQVLEGKKWKEGYLDYAADMSGDDTANSVTHLDRHTLQVQAWIVLEPIHDQFVEWKVSGSNLQRVWAYIQNIGLRHSLIKIFSRWRERSRNRKFLSLGIGRRDHLAQDESFLFLAVNHPECVDRIAIEKFFCIPWSNPSFDLQNGIAFFSETTDKSIRLLAERFRKYAAWTSFSDLPLDEATLKQELHDSVDLLKKFLQKKEASRILPMSSSSSSRRESTEIASKKDHRLSATLFGLGNYAKTVVMPALKSAVRIDRIHEIDPLQLGVQLPQKISCDTRPLPRTSPRAEPAQVYLICGYHHTHVELAKRAFEIGAAAVIEKPLATNREDLLRFKQAVVQNKGRFFLCFQRRYSSFNRFIFEDLGRDQPLDFRGIVHEIPLPPKHWYNWPSSGSRLISNGCHWLDHFLFLNYYTEADAFEVAEEDGNYRIWMRLKNRAQFHLLLTNTGSSRLGVREYIEIARPKATVRIYDQMKLESENDHRLIRRIRARSKYENLWDMYGQIGDKLLRGEEGDSLQALYSSELILMLEEELKRNSMRFDIDSLPVISGQQKTDSGAEPDNFHHFTQRTFPIEIAPEIP